MLRLQEKAWTDRLSLPVRRDVLLEASVLRSTRVQVRLQGGGSRDDHEGESGCAAGEDSQSLMGGLFVWTENCSGIKKFFSPGKGKGFEMQSGNLGRISLLRESFFFFFLGIYFSDGKRQMWGRAIIKHRF